MSAVLLGRVGRNVPRLDLMGLDYGTVALIAQNLRLYFGRVAERLRQSLGNESGFQRYGGRCIL